MSMWKYPCGCITELSSERMFGRYVEDVIEPCAQHQDNRNDVPHTSNYHPKDNGAKLVRKKK